MILQQGTIKGCLPNTRNDSTKSNKGDTHSAAFEHETTKMDTTCEFEKGGSNETSESCIKTLLSQSQLPTQQHEAYLWSRAVGIVAAIVIVAAVEPVAD